MLQRATSIEKDLTREGKKMSKKVKEIQEYLETKGIVVAETTIIDAAIKIATRWGGNEVFVCEFEKEKGGDKNEKNTEC
jgi:hypothetical protein